MARAGAVSLAVMAIVAAAACLPDGVRVTPPSGDVDQDVAALLEIPEAASDPDVTPQWPACSRSSQCHRGETCTSGACGAPVTPPGALAADFTLTDLNPNSPTDAQDITLSALSGHVVVLYFAWST